MKKYICLLLFILSYSGVYAEFSIEIDFSVHNDISPENIFYLGFGVNSEASNSVDLNLGENSLPPYPFSAFYAAMEFIDSSQYNSDSTKYYDDIRTIKNIQGIPTDKDKFFIKYKLHLLWYNSNKIIFNWGSAPNNENIDSIFMKDALNGAYVNINMKTTNNYELINDGIDNLYFYVYYTKIPSSVQNIVYLESDKIYPNPVVNYINIISENYTGFKIYDIYGNIMMQNNKYQDRIDVSFLTQGIYLLYLNYYDGKFKICKFIKN